METMKCKKPCASNHHEIFDDTFCIEERYFKKGTLSISGKKKSHSSKKECIITCNAVRIFACCSAIRTGSDSIIKTPDKNYLVKHQTLQRLKKYSLHNWKEEEVQEDQY